MDTAEEKFFEQLAKGRPEETGGGYDVVPVKATATTRLRTASRKTAEPEAVEASDETEEGQLTIDVYQTPNDIIIESTIAGVKPEDIDVNVTNDSVTIRGERRRESKVEDDDYFYQECYWGRFSRAVILPQEIDPDAATVTLKNGVLTVRLPKLNRKKTKKLRVKLE